MERHMKTGAIFAMSLLVIIAGYYLFIFNDPINIDPKNDTPILNTDLASKTILKASDLALSVSDISGGWEISSRGEMLRADINKYGLNLGWQEGYNVVFRKIDSKDIILSQSVSVYPKENISLLLDGVKNALKSFKEFVNGERIDYLKDDFGNRYRYEELSNPQIGDDSVAYKLIYLDNSNVAYYLEFVKSNYYEQISGLDYELIKELAKKSEKRI